jgi:putative ABC transport system permease protein
MAAIAAISLLVGGIGIANVMLVTVRERTREIGVLKTLGFSGGRILRLVLGESILLALIGGIPGLVIAYLVIGLMRENLMNFVPMISLSPDLIAAGVAIMVALGILTGLVPALNAMRLKIASALGRS